MKHFALAKSIAKTHMANYIMINHDIVLS